MSHYDCRGISDEALELSDLRCNIPMNGMVDSFNVSVAAGIVMHLAICNRNSRMVMILFCCILHARGKYVCRNFSLVTIYI